MAAPLTVLVPVTGTVIDVADVEDPVFSAGLVGPGLGIEIDWDAVKRLRIQ